MKHLVFCFLLLCTLGTIAQPTGAIISPSTDGIGLAKPVISSGAIPHDGKSLYWDFTNEVWRQYISTDEVLKRLPVEQRIIGQLVYVNIGGSLANGVVTGGVNGWYCFRDNITTLVPITTSGGGGGSAAGLEDVLAISNSTTRNLLTSGNIGIGTTSPRASLEVLNSAWLSNGMFQIDNSNGGQLRIEQQAAGRGTYYRQNINGGTDIELRGFDNTTGKSSYASILATPYDASIITSSLSHQNVIKSNVFGIALTHNANTPANATTGLRIAPTDVALVYESSTNNINNYFKVGATDATAYVPGRYIFGGTKAIQPPVGSTTLRTGTFTAGAFRWNTDSTSLEVYNGSFWQKLLTSGSAVSGGSIPSYTANGGVGKSNNNFFLKDGTLPGSLHLNANNFPVSFFDVNGFIVNTKGSSIPAIAATQTDLVFGHHDDIKLNTKQVTINAQATQINGFVNITEDVTAAEVEGSRLAIRTENTGVSNVQLNYKSNAAYFLDIVKGENERDTIPTLSKVRKMVMAVGLTPGPAGANGVAGVAGKSAYQLWLDAGNSGTQAQYLASLTGPVGPAGAPGANGLSATAVNIKIDSAFNKTKIFFDPTTLPGTGDSLNPIRANTIAVQEVEVFEDVEPSISGHRFVFVEQEKALYVVGSDSARRFTTTARAFYNPAPPLELVFTDNFNGNGPLSNYNNWVRIEGVDPEPDLIGNGIAYYNQTGPSSYIHYGPGNITNGIIEANIQVAHHVAMGFIFRVQDENNYYLLEVGHNEYTQDLKARFYKKVAGNYTQIGTEFNYANAEGSPASVKATFQGSTFKVSVRGIENTFPEDNQFTGPGKVGIHGSGSGNYRNMYGPWKAYRFNN